MDLTLVAILVGLGAAGGFSAGLLGVGGGVLMFPLLYYVPPLLGLVPHGCQDGRRHCCESGVFFYAYRRHRASPQRPSAGAVIALTAGTVSAATAFAGSVASQWASERFLLVLFGVVTVIAVLIMLAARASASETNSGGRAISACRPLPLARLFARNRHGHRLSRRRQFHLCARVDLSSIGYRHESPSAAACSVAIMSTASGFLGKLVTGQIPLVVAGARRRRRHDGRVGGRTRSSDVFRARCCGGVYAVLVALIAVRIWLTILGLDS